ncbi:energy transducer TonB [Desulfuromusa kysingii]|nr:energy transducer TonB [Desulfuromusa kysingii]
MGVTYISRSLDSVRPQLAAEGQSGQTASRSPQNLPRVEPMVPQKTQNNSAVPVVERKTVMQLPKSKRSFLPPKTTPDTVVELPLDAIEKETIDFDPIEYKTAPLIAEQNFEDPQPVPPAGAVAQPLQPQSAVLESSLTTDTASSEGISNSGETSTDSQNLSSGTKDLNQSQVSQGFTDALPHYEDNPPPRYPDVAKLRGWEGTVVFKATILENGRVERLKIMTSSGYRSLDSAARKAISRWTFTPATTFGVAVESVVEIPISFSLKDL